MRDRGAFFAWLAVCVIWGTTYLAIKVALEGIPPFLIGGIRYVIAGVSLIVWVIARGGRLPPRHLWGQLAVTGGLLLGLGNGGVLVAEQWVPSGLAAVVIATTPFWMVGVDWLYAKGVRPSLPQWAGLLVGFTGILLLVWPDLATGTTGGWRFAAGLVALQVACAAWSLGSAISRKIPQTGVPLPTTALQMLFGGLWMLTAGTLLGEWRDATFPWPSILAVLYLAYIGGLAGFVAYMYALARLPVSFVSLYTYVNPVIAIVLGTLFLGEPLDARMALAVAVILGGMTLVTRVRVRP
ncbi:MAG: EamA family transporter [Vicinamibacterales bacterium]